MFSDVVMNDAFRRGAREGFVACIPVAVGWRQALALGVFHRTIGAVPGAGVLPSDWSLEFMATIALLVMLVAAALAALVVPDTLLDAGEFDPLNPKLAAALVVAAVCLRTRNPWLPFLAGMAVMLLLRKGLGG